MPKIIKLEPQGFCFGVLRALRMMQDVALSTHPKPWYLIGNLVHNRFVKDYLVNKNFIIIEDLDKEAIIDQIDCGTVIFSAHGISNNIKEKALSKGLNVIDATCPFVTKSFGMIKEHLEMGYEILYLGKRNHPETEAALSISTKVHLIEQVEDIDHISLSTNLIALTNQTTMSKYDMEQIEEYIKMIFQNVVIMDKVCYATKIRQEVIRKTATEASEKSEKILFLIVGDKTSNNSKKLMETSKIFSQKDVYHVEQLDDLPFEIINQYQIIYLTSGTSTPNVIVEEIYNYLIDGNYLPKKSILTSNDFFK